MRVRYASRIVTRVFTLLVMTASLATNARVSATLSGVFQERTGTLNDQPYVGRYQLDPQFNHEFVIYVSVENDSLWLKPTDLRARRMIAESESRFSDSEIPDLRLVFIKDEKGNVTGLTLNSGTGDIRVNKMPPPVPTVVVQETKVTHYQ